MYLDKIENLKDKKSILIAPLNWGLGHASRSLVLIHHFIKEGKKVGIASDGLSLTWLQEELKEYNLDFFELPGYDVDYRSSSMNWNMIRQFPKIQRAIKLENRITSKIVELWSPDLILSDNRYGVHHPEVESIMLTHQLSMDYEGKLTATAFEMQINNWTKDFDRFWIPDHEDQRLTGSMTNNSSGKPIHFIGPLSRFAEAPKDGKGILVILSGPEPQRTKLEENLCKQLEQHKEKITIVRGSDSTSLPALHDNYKVIQLAGSEKLEALIHESRMVITRSGYSSLMDFDVLKKPVIMIPTPGQKEQEYLAELHKGNEQMRFVKQGESIAKYLS